MAITIGCSDHAIFVQVSTAGKGQFFTLNLSEIVDIICTSFGLEKAIELEDLELESLKSRRREMHPVVLCLAARFYSSLRLGRDFRPIVLIGYTICPTLSLSLQKYVRKHKGGVKMCRMVLKMRITRRHKCDQNVCNLWFAKCVLIRFQS